MTIEPPTTATEPPTEKIEPPTEEIPPAWTPPPGGVPEADVPPAAGHAPPGGGVPGADVPPTAGHAPPPPPPPPGANLPPWAGGPAFSREHLVRPRQGRYVAGVCAALARATNTDPVLWRVLVAVLGIISGVGVLLYLLGWLMIPAEGDTASPIESLLGKGRAGLPPLSIILLGAGAALSFVFVVGDGMRASVLAAAIVFGAVLLIKRGGTNRSEGRTFPPPGDTAAPGAQSAGYAPAGFPPPAPAAPPTEPMTTRTGPGSTPTRTEPGTAAFSAAPTRTEPGTMPFPPAPTLAEPAFKLPDPPAGGYRPPFAPHGPWAGSTQAPYPPQPPRPPKPPKPPREPSKLGRLTFFALFVVIGVLAVFDMAGAGIAVSVYFAAALVTIALGLVVGAWFGRARGLIALALVAAIGLGISSGVERWGSELGNSVYRPQSLGAVADRYDFTAGNATLDLREIDFTGQQQTVTLTMKLGRMEVLLPPAVDTTTTLQMKDGHASILGEQFENSQANSQTVTNQGSDGAGGGTLRLDLQMDTGIVEVTR